jgi:DNA-binding beta-propeller fold protein YncE
MVGRTDGTGTAALFDAPQGICSNGAYLYVADSNNHNVRRIDAGAGVVTTFAGSTLGVSGNADFPGTSARFFGPVGICTDGTNLFVADAGNHSIRKIIIATAAVSTLAGSTSGGTNDGTGNAALFNSPVALCTDGTNLYVADSANNNIRKIVISTRVVTTLAGSTSATSGSTDGAGTAALFNNPHGIGILGSNLCVVESSSGSVRIVQPASGLVTTQVLPSNNWGFASYVGASPVYDGSLYLYSCSGNLIYKTDTTSWYGIRAWGDGGSYNGLCFAGTDMYVTDYNFHAVLKVVSIGVR